jgi:hypothetical protein
MAIWIPSSEETILKAVLSSQFSVLSSQKSEQLSAMVVNALGETMFAELLLLT